MAGRKEASSTTATSGSKVRRPDPAQPLVLKEPPLRAPNVLLMMCTIVVVGVVVLVHWPALSAQAALFDDQQYLTYNHLVRNPSWASARRFLSEVLEPSTVEGYYQPLAMISLMLDYAMGGRPEHLMPFHRTSLVLHAVNTALIILLLYQLFGQPWIAAAVGLLFGVHPLTVEPIPWVGERKTLLATFFALWCLVVYVRYARRPNWKPYAACMGLYVLALMSKPTSTPLPVVMLLLDFWPLRRLSKRAVLEKLPFFAVGLVFSVITVISQARTAQVDLPSEYPPSQIPLILCHNIIFYLYKIVWPAGLSSHYPFPQPLALSDPMVLAGVIGTCVLVPTLLISLRWTRVFLTGWLIFFMAIFPTMGVLGFTIVIASDKYAYLPSIGPLLIVAWLLGLLWGAGAGTTGGFGRRSAAVGAVVALAALEAVGTRHHLARWQDGVGYLRYMLVLAPDSANLHSLLGNTLADRDELDEALKHHKEAVRLQPDLARARNNLANCLDRLGRLDAAVEQYREALRLRPTYAGAEYNLATVLGRNGRLDEAVDHLTRLLQRRPNLPKAHNNLGAALINLGRYDQAVEHFVRVLQLDPECAEAQNNLGFALARLGRFDEAIGHYMQALKQTPGNPDVLRNLGFALMSKGRLSDAAAYYQQALQSKPDDAEIHNDLANSLVRLGRVNEAVEHYSKALRLKPGYVDAKYKLAKALASNGRLEEAVGQFTELLKLKPDFPEVHNNLGAALSRLGRSDQAMEHFVRAVQLNPEYAEAQNNLGVALARQGRLDEAVGHFKQALGRAPRDPDVLRNLGFVLMSKGRLSEAAAYYQQALQYRPNDAEIHNDLGIVLAQQGNLAEAIAHFREALRLRPDMAQAAENLRRALAQKGIPKGGGAATQSAASGG